MTFLYLQHVLLSNLSLISSCLYLLFFIISSSVSYFFSSHLHLVLCPPLLLLLRCLPFSPLSILSLYSRPSHFICPLSITYLQLTLSWWWSDKMSFAVI